MCQTQENLRNDLKKFGLNPNEWTLRKLAKEKFKIAHVKDEEFCFLGETQKKGLIPQWAKLQLISC